jgi:hypothetical protein
MNIQIQCDWTWSSKPPTPGLYAIMYCWEIQEGIFTSTSRWNGDAWTNDYPVTGYAGPFHTEAEAKAWADAHNPDYL